MQRAIPLLVFAVTGASVSLALAPPRLGDQFQVNAYTLDRQWKAAVASDAAGNFLVTWESEQSSGEDTDSWSVWAQRYDSGGQAIGSEFQVNSYTTSHQLAPAAAMDSQGDFVVVWTSLGSYGTDSSDYSIQAQVYDASGSPTGNQFQVNSYTNSQQKSAAIATDLDGDFVVVWQSYRSGGTDRISWSVEARRFDKSGAPVGGQFQVNSYTSSHQRYPSVAMDANGNFIVAWQSRGSAGTDTDLTSIQAQRYDLDGNPIGSEFQVNSYTTNQQSYPAVASDTDGNFLVAWQSIGSPGPDNSGRSIQAKLYASNGSALVEQFQVNSFSTNQQVLAAVAADSAGDFVVTWKSIGSWETDNSHDSIQAQAIRADGTLAGGQFQVNSYTTSQQSQPEVATNAEGDFVVVWDSNGSFGSDLSRLSVQAQRFDKPIFVDNLESGDTSIWTQAMP